MMRRCYSGRSGREGDLFQGSRTRGIVTAKELANESRVVHSSRRVQKSGPAGRPNRDSIGTLRRSRGQLGTHLICKIGTLLERTLLRYDGRTERARRGRLVMGKRGVRAAPLGRGVLGGDSPRATETGARAGGRSRAPLHAARLATRHLQEPYRK